MSRYILPVTEVTHGVLELILDNKFRIEISRYGGKNQ